MQSWQLKRLLTAAEVSEAFASLCKSAIWPLEKTEEKRQMEDTRSSGAAAWPPLQRYTTCRCSSTGCYRDHIEIPLVHLRSDTAVLSSLPLPVQRVVTTLQTAAEQYVEVVLQHPSVERTARLEILQDLEKRSVLRVLRYRLRCGCRPHVDPGLCTALLCGSAGGLEIRAEGRSAASQQTSDTGGSLQVAEELPRTPEGIQKATMTPLDLLPGWETVTPRHPGEVLLLNGNMLAMLSRGVLPAALHRVRPDWNILRQPAESPPVGVTPTPAADARFNIVVELRPAQPKRWYRLCSRDNATTKSTTGKRQGEAVHG